MGKNILVHTVIKSWKGDVLTVGINQYKKEDEKGIVGSSEQEQWENSNQDERLPEFDVIGTALNDI
jgi:hypothetical protein